MGRITGLDAAYPLYMNTGNEGHLARTDAAFVDVIHTDGGILGFPNPLGHVDFYPNGGKSNQPGCNLENAFQRSFSRFINQYSKKNRNPFLAQISRRKASPLFSRFLFSQSRVAIIARGCSTPSQWRILSGSRPADARNGSRISKRIVSGRPKRWWVSPWIPEWEGNFIWGRTRSHPSRETRRDTDILVLDEPNCYLTSLERARFREGYGSNGWKRKKKRKRKMKIVPFYYTEEMWRRG